MVFTSRTKECQLSRKAIEHKWRNGIIGYWVEKLLTTDEGNDKERDRKMRKSTGEEIALN